MFGKLYTGKTEILRGVYWWKIQLDTGWDREGIIKTVHHVLLTVGHFKF